MRIAIPMSDGEFCPHFGRSTQVLLCEVDPADRRIDRPRTLDRPHAGCDSLPGWLAELAVDRVLAGGIGGGAQQGLAQRGIAISHGYEGPEWRQVIEQFFDQPEGGDATACSHDEHEHHHCKHD